ncbi:uncharacterized protein C1orf159 homolog isoform X4 [Ambystoma mexicanum]|uniref:uncharacterized protein C1orf159 homolog isoform X4 n=1 Tax=Ambystoma mexicanum TaxID=8296 RepID=UPI0037E99463
MNKRCHLPWAMAWPNAALLLSRLTLQLATESVGNLVSLFECCMDQLNSNGSCPTSDQCSPATSRASESHMNTSTTAPNMHSIGSPEVAVSLLLGTLFISLFLILSVASFFYLKRANRLPDLFYRQKKASILQPSETASMIPTPSSSVRKPRYVRRERSVVMSASAAQNPSKETRVSNV